MLSITHYTYLWTKYFAPIVGAMRTPILMPSHADYIIRENMLEDYLDIFRGINTRGVRGVSPFTPFTPPTWYYDHPFFDEKGELIDKDGVINEKPCIKYILIAEAAPERSTSIPKNNPKYIYNTKRNGGGAYITAPLDAFGINANRMNTVDRLLALANKGVLVLDLFHFAINYNLKINGQTIRESFIENKKSIESFFRGTANSYSIQNRITYLGKEGLLGEGFNDLNPNACFIAPQTTSHYLAGLVNDTIGCCFLNFRLGVNSLSKNNGSIHGNYITGYTKPNTLLPRYPLVDKRSVDIDKIPIFCCSTYNETRGDSPRALFIKSALNL